MSPSEAEEDLFPVQDNKDHVSLCSKGSFANKSLYKNEGSGVSKLSVLNYDTNPLCVLHPFGLLSTPTWDL